MELESTYEISRTAEFIHSRHFVRVALQFPDDLLKDSTRVVRALRQSLRPLNDADSEEVGLFVMADTTYGSCCVDEVGASHINADCVVHYGHTCLSPTSTLPALVVFGKASINISSCTETLAKYASANTKPIMVLYGLEYAHAVPCIREALEKETMLSESTSKSEIHFADVAYSVIEPSSDCRDSDRLLRQFDGCSTAIPVEESETRHRIGGLTWSVPHRKKLEDFLVFWIGFGNSAFANFVLTYNGCEIVMQGLTNKRPREEVVLDLGCCLLYCKVIQEAYRSAKVVDFGRSFGGSLENRSITILYDPTLNCLETDFSQQKRILKRRYYLVEKAKDANIVGILVGTLGVAGYLDMIHQMSKLIKEAGKKAYTLAMGRPNPAKLANFPECDVFIYVSCAQTTLFDSKEFLAPVITPFEAMLAFSRGGQWTGEYLMEFRDLINPCSIEMKDELQEARFSFLHGGYVEDHHYRDDEEEEKEGINALANATEKNLQLSERSSNTLVKGVIKSGADYYASRSYHGLEIQNNPVPEPYLIGRSGKASGYKDEKGR